MGSTRERGEDRGRPLPVTPDPSIPELAEWMERLFDEEHPQKIEVIAVFGRHHQTHDAKAMDTQPFKPNQAKPTKEYCVTLSNRFLAAAHRDCDTRRREQVYEILASNPAKGADPYTCYTICLEPRTRYLKLDAKGDPDEDDPDGGDKFGGDKLLRRVSTVFEDDRERANMALGAFGGVQGVMRDMLKDTYTMLKESMDQNRQLVQQNIAMMKEVETAKSSEADRELSRDKQRFWLEQIKDGTSLVKGLLPHVVNRAAGAEILPNARKPESVSLEMFISGCSEAQIEAAFGKYADVPDAEGRPTLLAPGIFSVRQTYIIDGVAKGALDVDKLDLLIDGQDAITTEQFEGALRIFGDNKLIPLRALFMERVQRRPNSTPKE